MSFTWSLGRSFWEVIQREEGQRENVTHRCLHLRCKCFLVGSTFALPRNPVGNSRVFFVFHQCERRRKEPSCYLPPSMNTSELSQGPVSLTPTCRWKETEGSPCTLCQHCSVSRLTVAGLPGTAAHAQLMIAPHHQPPSIVPIRTTCHSVSSMLFAVPFGRWWLQIKFFTGGALPSCLGVKFPSHTCREKSLSS